MKILLILAIVAYASATPLLGSKRCTWGPAYWCKDIKHASECGAVDHCTSAVWSKNFLTEKVQTTVECQICQAAVVEVRQMLSDKKTEDEIKQYLLKACDLLPSGLSKECTNTVNKDFDVVMKVFLSELTPDVVCQLFGLCKRQIEYRAQQSPVVEAQKAPQATTAESSDLCSVCKDTMTKLRDDLTNKKTQTEIEDFIKAELCARLGSLKEQCDNAIDEYGAIIFELLEQELDPNAICRAIGFCTKQGLSTIDLTNLKTIRDHAKMAKTLGITVECTVCKMVMTKLETMLEDKTTEEEIVTALEKVCSLFPTSYYTDCKQYVTSYGSAVLRLILQEVKPDQICGVLGLCKQSNVSQHKELLGSKRCTWGPSYWCSHVKHASECGAVQHCMDTVWKNQVYHTSLKAGVECDICKTAVTEVRSMVADKKTQDEVKQYILKVCTLLPAEIGKECTDLVNEDYDTVVKVIISQLDPNAICTIFGLCANSETVKDNVPRLEEVLRFQPVQPEKKVGASTGCEFCKIFMAKAKDLVKGNKTQQEVEDFIKTELCARLEGLKTACDNAIDEYGQMIFELLVNEMDPETVCRAIGFCTSAKDTINAAVLQQAQVHMTKTHSVKGSTECVVCEFVMTQLDKLLAKNASEAEIMSALEKVCSLLPKTISAECKSFVDTYGPAVIQLLIGELKPEQVCTFLGLCKSQNIAYHQIQGQVQCELCKTVMMYLDALLKETSTVQEIETVVEKVCNFLPNSMQAECIQLVKDFGPQIIDSLEKMINPNLICAEIKLCDSAANAKKQVVIVPKKANLLGTEECSYGPAFWCASQENAKRCKAEEHCRRHWWGKN